MPPLINAQGISKAFGANPLFQNISFTVSEGDCIGLIGPNGSGKSTLLRILAGQVDPDGGEVAARKRLRLTYVEQDSKFNQGITVRSVVEKALERSTVPESERGTRFAETLGRAGFEDLERQATALSGGWQKRLALVEALVQAPDILLLDEPTNHLDLAGIEWLELVLERATFACAETTAPFWRRRKSFCTPKPSVRKPWKTWFILKSSGCAAGRKRAPENR